MVGLTPREELFAIAMLQRHLDDRMAGRPDPEHLVAGAERAPEAARSESTLAADGAAVGTDRIGHYRPVRELGRGGQAVVYLAEDCDFTRRQVALKVVRLAGSGATGAALRLRREIDLVASLEIEGVCPIYECGVHGDDAWIAMRYVRGETLAQMLARASPAGLPDRNAIGVRMGLLEQVARIVHRVHERGVVHRDLKPSNVMVGVDGAPVVLDFGVAQSDHAGPALTRTAEAPGTPAYMAPEQVRGERTLDRRVDVWALGCILFELLTHARPFAGATPHLLEQNILHGAAPDARARHRLISRDLAVVIATALAKEPSHRYRSAAELADDLARVRQHRPIQARPPGRAVRLLRFARRNPALAAMLALLFTTITAALVVSLSLLAQADRAQQFVYHLSDRARLDRLQWELQHELDRDPRQRPRLEDWQRRWLQLASRRGEHEAFLATLRRRALPETPSPADAEVRRRQKLDLEQMTAEVERGAAALAQARSVGDATRVQYAEEALAAAKEVQANAAWRLSEPVRVRFADSELQTMHDMIEETVRRLRAFNERRPGLETALAGRLLAREAQALHQKWLETAGDDWDAALVRISDPNGRYGGLVFPPQEGLVPLGPDPSTQLEEFAHLASGDVPRRDAATGVLECGERAGIILVLLPGGVLAQGSEPPRPGSPSPWGSSLPASRCAVDLAPFFIGKHEVTQAQWARMAWQYPAWWAPRRSFPLGPATGLRNPVEFVDHAAAVDHLRRALLVLPTEAQWEYACRAGCGSTWSCGDDPSALGAVANLADEVLAAWLGSASPSHSDPFPGHAPVGSLASNGFGLHDMHGNVREWCRDQVAAYGSRPTGPDGQRPAAAAALCVRGGSFRTPPIQAASFYRGSEPPRNLADDLGVRAARAVVDLEARK
jgi:serine/threonine protein kinase/formylglycine-generating enzyme required for sulfatase activity